MFHDHFGISENPFANTPDPDFLFMSTRHKEALAHLVYGVNGESGFVLLTGGIGTGKTTLCRYLADHMPDGVEFALCINPRRSEAELLESICDEMGISVHGDRNKVKDLTDSINVYLLDLHARGGRAVLIIDEAQNLEFAQLEQVRLLTNLETSARKLLQIILVGQPELKDRLDQPDLVNLSQRITARYHLTAMNSNEVNAYIVHRLSVAGFVHEVFTPAAVDIIFQATNGVPRLVNSICERCMLGAYALGITIVDAELARESATEVLGTPAVKPTESKGSPQRIVVFAAVLLLIAFGVLLPLQASDAPAIDQVRALAEDWPLVGQLLLGTSGR